MPSKALRILLVYPEPFFCSGGGIGTYLKHAISAHLKAGREIYLLTWATGIDGWFHQVMDEADLHPLRLDQVTILRISESDIGGVNPIGMRAKNISDILYPHIAAIEEWFKPDLIESPDYAVPLHTYLEYRRCGMHSEKVPVAIFNHGLLNDIWPASALIPSEWTVRELVLEQQVIRWADMVLAPSEAAAKRIREIRRTDNGVHVVREPYAAKTWNRQESFASSNFAYFGRVSFAKGVDLFAGMLTAVAGEWPISKITFLGRREIMPFRRSDAIEFINARIAGDLRSKVRFVDNVPREKVDDIISHAGFFGNFSRSETFSYTTLEALSNGVIPLVLRNSPMAEMLPPEVREKGTFIEVPHRTEVIRDVLEFWRDNYDKLIGLCQDYAAALTDPSAYAKRYDEIMAAAPARLIEPARPRYTGQDITVLMATHNDADLLLEAVASLDQQTEKVGEILVIDDGSSDKAHISRLDDLASKGIIRLLRVRNMGLVAGRNVLVENARSELVIFLDADDKLEPTYVEKTLRALNRQPDRWSAVLTRRKNFGLNDHEISSFLLDTPMHWAHNDFRMTALIKRSVLLDIRFNPAIRNGEADDWWWWLNFTIRGHEAAFVPEPLFRYRTVSGSMSLPWSEGQAALTIELLQRAVTEAVHRKFDLGPALQIALMTAYRNARDTDILRVQTSSAAVNENFLTYQRLTRPVIRIFGPKFGGIVVNFVERTAYSHPVVRRCARFTLRRLSSLMRSSAL
jgi:glycosyltransferase involved in cell wall biosynthesis